jgi:hypothetical protein
MSCCPFTCMLSLSRLLAFEGIKIWMFDGRQEWSDYCISGCGQQVLEVGEKLLPIIGSCCIVCCAAVQVLVHSVLQLPSPVLLFTCCPSAEESCCWWGGQVQELLVLQSPSAVQAWRCLEKLSKLLPMLSSRLGFGADHPLMFLCAGRMGRGLGEYAQFFLASYAIHVMVASSTLMLFNVLHVHVQEKWINILPCKEKRVFFSFRMQFHQYWDYFLSMTWKATKY